MACRLTTLQDTLSSMQFRTVALVSLGLETWQIADLLKQNNIAVILNQMHSLPNMMDDDIDQPFKTPAMLQKAGVLFAINDEHEESRFRNRRR